MSDETTQVTSEPSDVITEVPSHQVQELNAVQGFAKFMDDGGIFMWIILGMWI